MEENIKFRSDFYYDLASHKEYNQLLTHSTGLNAPMQAMTLLSMLFLLTQLENTTTLIVTLLINGFWIFYRLFMNHRNKDGGLIYKQILHSNDDSIPHQIITLTETAIRSRNPRTEKEIEDSLENIRYIMESENLLVLVTDLKMCHILDKRFITGGSREELIAHLRQHCPKLKKKIKTGRFGHLVGKLLYAVAVIGLILGSCVLFRVSDRITGKLSNNMTYAEMAAELEALGIAITQQTIQELETFDAEYEAEFGSAYYADFSQDSKVYDLLYWEGSGIYDEEIWDWTPSQSGVYWFDMEVYNLASIYSDFFRGLSAMNPELSFANVSEDYTTVDLTEGTGEILVTFEYQGQHYELAATYDYDWFDLNMIKEVGSILASDAPEARLWFYYDDGQGILLYYGTDDQVSRLQQKTGLKFIRAEFVDILSIF